MPARAWAQSMKEMKKQAKQKRYRQKKEKKQAELEYPLFGIAHGVFTEYNLQ